MINIDEFKCLKFIQYLKSCFDEMPVQMLVIVDVIALHWDPITLEALREATGLEKINAYRK